MTIAVAGILLLIAVPILLLVADVARGGSVGVTERPTVLRREGERPGAPSSSAVSAAATPVAPRAAAPARTRAIRPGEGMVYRPRA